MPSIRASVSVAHDVVIEPQISVNTIPLGTLSQLYFYNRHTEPYSKHEAHS